MALPNAPIIAYNRSTASQIELTVTPEKDSTGFDLGWSLWSGGALTTQTGDTRYWSTALINGLGANTQYYVSARLKNASGTGPWASRLVAVTQGPPFAPSISYSNDNIRETQAIIDFQAGYNGGMDTRYDDIGWNTVDADPLSNTIQGLTGTGSNLSGLVVNLTPGTTYYFKGRSRNYWGTGPWSQSVKLTTLYGVNVNVSGTWKHAITWINVSGTWKRAKVFVMDQGVWREAR